MLACAGEGGSGPDDPIVLDPGVTTPAVPAPDEQAVPTSALPADTGTRTLLPGFGEVVIEVRQTDGGVIEWCLLLAETNEQRRRGLMQVEDPELGGYDGMLFRFQQPVPNAAFWNRNVPVDLSIAYVGPEGDVFSIEEMAPCEDSDQCPTYPSGGDTSWAVEVPVAAGGVASLGLDRPGAVLVDTGRTCSA
jgi:uncharacterized membrane protein (UPF0127 family)